MELQEVVDRYARSIEHVDATIAQTRANTRTGVVYMPGFKALNEEPAIDAIDDAWEYFHPKERQVHRMKVNYPSLPATAKIDHVITTDGLGPMTSGVSRSNVCSSLATTASGTTMRPRRCCSPYLKDRGLLHDALRLREYGFTRRIAVIGYGFDYDAGSVAHALALHTSPQAVATVREIEKNIRTNGPLYNRPLIEFADAILRMRGWTVGPRAEASFDAWQHPAGGKGVVFGWEIRRPQQDQDYDPRNPW